MSNFIRSESISVINESLSLPLIDDSAAALIARHCERQLKLVASAAAKIARHSFSVKLAPDHLHQALEQLHEPPILTGISHCKQLNNQSVKQWDLPRFKQASDDVYYVDDPVVDFDTILTAPLPPAPAHVALSLHWLAIEGVQPRIPQNPATDSINQLGQSSDEKPLLVPSHASSSETALAQFKPLVAHLLSKEQQLYFERATEAIIGDPLLREATLHSLSTDSGMQQLVPYFVHFVGDEIAHHLRDLRRLRACLSLAETLIHSRHLQVEPYLHQLLPSVLTCVLGKHLCSSPHEQHWVLRDEAAQLTAHICKQWTPVYPTLQSRISRTLLAAWLDVDRSLPTHYGALQGLGALGPHVVKPCILPYIASYCALLEPLLDDHRNPVKRVEAATVHQALVHIIGQLIQSEILSPTTMAIVQAKKSSDQRGYLSLSQSSSQSPLSIAMDEIAKLDAREEQSNIQQRQARQQRKIDMVNQYQSRKRARDESTSQSPTQSTHRSLPINIFPSDLPIDQFTDLFGEALQPYIQSAFDQAAPAFPNNHTWHIGHMIV